MQWLAILAWRRSNRRRVVGNRRIGERVFDVTIETPPGQMPRRQDMGTAWHDAGDEGIDA